MLTYTGLLTPIHGDMYELTMWGQLYLERGDRRGTLAATEHKDSSYLTSRKVKVVYFESV